MTVNLSELEVLTEKECARIEAIAKMYQTTPTAVCARLLSIALSTKSVVRKVYPLAVENVFMEMSLTVGATKND